MSRGIRTTYDSGFCGFVVGVVIVENEVTMSPCNCQAGISWLKNCRPQTLQVMCGPQHEIFKVDAGLTGDRWTHAGLAGNVPGAGDLPLGLGATGFEGL